MFYPRFVWLKMLPTGSGAGSFTDPLSMKCVDRVCRRNILSRPSAGKQPLSLAGRLAPRGIAPGVIYQRDVFATNAFHGAVMSLIL
jgi:hypothetical protein